MTTLTPSRARPSAPPQGTRGILTALLILAALLGASVLIGWLLSTLTAQVLPGAPAFTILIWTLLALLLLAPVTLRAFPWLTNWFYLLPALVFILAFTVLPVVLTINYAFTNYSGQNSGNPDSATRQAAALGAGRRTVTLPELGEPVAEFLRCRTAACADATVVLYDEEASQPYRARVAGAQGRTLTLAAPVPDALTVTQATRINSISYVGLANFQQIFGKASRALWPVFLWTVVFAFSTIFLNAVAGLILGILLFNKRLKGRNIYRTLLFLPWAIPTVISVQMWVALFNQQFGIVNKTLGLLGVVAIPWLNDPLWAKVSILLVNLWLGFPYMMTATISALSTINEDLYEAAEIDGASRWQQITSITLPLLRNSFTPILLSGFAFNFNNFGIIYLLTAGGPAQEGRESTAQSTDILLSWGYNTAFVSSGGQNFALASAIALIIFFLTLAISLVNFKAAGVFEEARK
ncbi:ABC transporter permease subunit [Deinococcus taeanensis]|uniref:ABC transporter permease subunit n=1 Tax=Deinococcus taeanensis TaxID=2737050 RepID=UPI001CDB78FE|nr:ABC transporter permease subunit [Deinococcus taeanensis]UBV41464.1 ABC transporter permease subunit [Deinococcus taeanensis]